EVEPDADNFWNKILAYIEDTAPRFPPTEVDQLIQLKDTENFLTVSTGNLSLEDKIPQQFLNTLPSHLQNQIFQYLQKPSTDETLYMEYDDGFEVLHWTVDRIRRQDVSARSIYE